MQNVHLYTYKNEIHIRVEDKKTNALYYVYLLYWVKQKKSEILIDIKPKMHFESKFGKYKDLKGTYQETCLFCTYRYTHTNPWYMYISHIYVYMRVPTYAPLSGSLQGSYKPKHESTSIMITKVLL